MTEAPKHGWTMKSEGGGVVVPGAQAFGAWTLLSGLQQDTRGVCQGESLKREGPWGTDSQVPEIMRMIIQNPR